jgi:hypothetical protein
VRGFSFLIALHNFSCAVGVVWSRVGAFRLETPVPKLHDLRSPGDVSVRSPVTRNECVLVLVLR